MSSTASGASVDADLALLRHITSHLSKISSSLAALAADAPWSERGYFDAAQHEKIESLFFQFIVGRRVLVSLASQGKLASGEISFSDHEGVASDNENGDDVLRALIALASALRLVVYEGALVQSFRGDKVAVAKLNEEFYRSDIKRGTFTQLSLECTDAKPDGRLRSLRKAYLLFCEGSSGDDDTQLSRLLKEDKRAAELSDMIHLLVENDIHPLCHELVGKSIFEPSIRNKVRHAKVAEVVRNVRSNTKHVLRETRAQTFKGVSRLKSPAAHLIRFSDEQKREVLNMLQPARDPYVGNPEDRAEAGLNAESIVRIYNNLPEGESARLLRQFQQSTLAPSSGEEKGMNADVIEAVAEGVIFNNLCYLMDTHVNRLLVLRPRITFEERTEALVSIFRYLGSKYDFGFNFANASAVVCTEIQYHSFNGKGRLDFELTKRAGHPTLSADDIVNFYLRDSESFDFILLALEDTQCPGFHAKIHTGDEGKTVLADLMQLEVPN